MGRAIFDVALLGSCCLHLRGLPVFLIRSAAIHKRGYSSLESHRDDPQRPRPRSRDQVNCLVMMAKSSSAHFCDSVHQGRPDNSQPSLLSSDASRSGKARPFHTNNMICLKVPCPWHESIKVNSSVLSTGCQVDPSGRPGSQ